MTRKVADCRNTPSVFGCTLTISGEEEEVVRAAVEHAVSVHEPRRPRAPAEGP
jgi:predicted small metal-binding protein